MIKELLLTVALLSGLQIANAASTDTVNIITYSDEAVVVAVDEPVEHKVVEIHMTMPEAPTPEEAKKRLKRLIKGMPLPGHGTCSGAFIGTEGEIITARHCVEGFDSWEVQTYDHQTYAATVIATSTLHDLAIIRIDKSDTPHFRLATSVKRGEHISILGSPLAITDTLSEGVVAKLNGDILFLDCSALPGNSGGPVFNSDGELVGVLNAGLIVGLGVTHLNLAQGLDAVKFFIREVAQKYPGDKR